MTAGVLLAHERWFVADEGLPTVWGSIAHPATAAVMAASALVCVAAWLAWRSRGRRDLLPGPLALGATPESLAVALGWLPVALAAHTSVALVVAGVQGQLFSPNLVLGFPARPFVGLAEVGVALLLFYGLLARAAAAALAGVWLVGVFLFGPVLLLEQAVFLGIAAFFFLAGRGPFGFDRLLGTWAGPDERRLHLAVPFLRIGVGVSIAWLALTEKLLNLPLALSFLEAYPHVNFLPALGMSVSGTTFLRLAGGVELTVGLLLLTGAFPRSVVLLLWLPFNLTLTLFGWKELVGHLPVYGIMLVILVWGAGGEADHQALRAGLAPPGPDGTPAGVPV